MYDLFYQLRKVNRALEACMLNPKHRAMLTEISQDIQQAIIEEQAEKANP